MMCHQVAVVVDIISKSNGTALPFLGRLGGKKKKEIPASGAGA